MARKYFRIPPRRLEEKYMGLVTAAADKRFSGVVDRVFDAAEAGEPWACQLVFKVLIEVRAGDVLREALDLVDEVKSETIRR